MFGHGRNVSVVDGRHLATFTIDSRKGFKADDKDAEGCEFNGAFQRDLLSSMVGR